MTQARAAHRSNDWKEAGEHGCGGLTSAWLLLQYYVLSSIQGAPAAVVWVVYLLARIVVRARLCLQFCPLRQLSCAAVH